MTRFLSLATLTGVGMLAMVATANAQQIGGNTTMEVTIGGPLTALNLGTGRFDTKIGTISKDANIKGAAEVRVHVDGATTATNAGNADFTLAVGVIGAQ